LVPDVVCVFQKSCLSGKRLAELTICTVTPTLEVCIVKQGAGVPESECNLHGMPPRPEVYWLKHVAHFSRLVSVYGQRAVAELSIATEAPTLEVDVPNVVKYGTCVLFSERDACGAARECVGAAGGRTRRGAAIADVPHGAGHRHSEAGVVELHLSDVGVAVCVWRPCASDALRDGPWGTLQDV
jgi:hypothetical protein